MFQPIVRTSAPVALIGGAQIAPKVLNIMQTHADICVAADGGADQLLAAGISPAAVVGDMDSVSPAARAKFSHVFHQIDDQDTTDFDKAVAVIDAPVILAAGFSGGRLDHTMAVLNSMVKGLLAHLILLSDDDVCFLARPSRTDLDLPVGTRVALLPFAKMRVDTAGLRWNLTGAILEPNGAISTSNAAAKTRVTIHSTDQMVLTLPLAALDAARAVVHAR